MPTTIQIPINRHGNRLSLSNYIDIIYSSPPNFVSSKFITKFTFCGYMIETKSLFSFLLLKIFANALIFLVGEPTYIRRILVNLSIKLGRQAICILLL